MPAQEVVRPVRSIEDAASIAALPPTPLPIDLASAEALLAASEALLALRTADDEPAMHAAAARFLACARAAVPVERILVFLKASLRERVDRNRRDAVERDRRVISRVIEAYYATSYEEPAAPSVERALDVRPVGIREVRVDGV